MLSGEKILWGDTVNGNIDRYFQRYIEPYLKLCKIPYYWHQQKKELKVYRGHTDFRSADRPENWEGFGYDKIILNEAGIILKNDYLYTNAVLPMLLDSTNSQLFALGVPKGKKNKDNKLHRFFDLHNQKGNPDYFVKTYSSYDNPFLAHQDIKDLEREMERMNPAMVQQEIYGQFVEGAYNTLFERESIELNRVNQYPSLRKIIVAIDPAISNTTKSDLTGIVVMGLGSNSQVYVLEDLSGRYAPTEWSAIATNAYNRWKANEVVAEANQGGDMVTETLRIYDKSIRVVSVHSSRGKFIRAEPVAALYDQGKIHHVGRLEELENEMVNWQGLSGEKSPDRLDALVHGVNRLLIKSGSTKFSS